MAQASPGGGEGVRVTPGREVQQFSLPAAGLAEETSVTTDVSDRTGQAVGQRDRSAPRPGTRGSGDRANTDT